MTNPFTALHPRIRQGLYLAYATVGLILGALQVYGTEDVGALDVSRCLEVLAYLGVPLGFTAASNVPSYEDVVDGDAPPPDERGESALGLVLTVLAIVVLVLLVLRLA